MILKGLGGLQTLVTKGLTRRWYLAPFREILKVVSKITIMLKKDSTLWKS